jgi:hypothetical protein
MELDWGGFEPRTTRWLIKDCLDSVAGTRFDATERDCRPVRLPSPACGYQRVVIQDSISCSFIFSQTGNFRSSAQSASRSSFDIPSPVSGTTQTLPGRPCVLSSRFHSRSSSGVICDSDGMGGRWNGIPSFYRVGQMTGRRSPYFCPRNASAACSTLSWFESGPAMVT